MADGSDARRLATIVFDAFDGYVAAHRTSCRSAAAHFAARDWEAQTAEAQLRLDLYGTAVDAVVARLGAGAPPVAATWASAKAHYAEAVARRPDAELAATFFNSVTRRLILIEGTAPDLEFLGGIEDRTPGRIPPAPVVRFADGDLATKLGALLDVIDLGVARYQPMRTLRLVATDVLAGLEAQGIDGEVGAVELLDVVFYRGQGAYVVGSLEVAGPGGGEVPFALAFHRTVHGLIVGAVLTDPSDVSVLFSYTRSAFAVDTESPEAIVRYVGRLLPHRRRAELYSALGHFKHAKTELYRDLMDHFAGSDERFEPARGIKGMVMIVFTLPGFDVVFKVIRDRFPPPKQTTRRRIMAKYRMVFRSDRAGRLIDAQEFEHLRFPVERFGEELLAELSTDATRSVTIEDGNVTLHHVYVERRVVPLDIYLREANPIQAQAAIVDYGRAIKNLAATNVFPGDMLLKNFGVTRGGRVVFYDYDEIETVTSCNFREMPDTDIADDVMSAEPWFGVGEHDVFPEEFVNFLGIRDDLRRVFDYHHSDLFGVRFWHRIQERLAAGEKMEVFPYRRGRRLGARMRRRTQRVE